VLLGQECTNPTGAPTRLNFLRWRQIFSTESLWALSPYKEKNAFRFTCTEQKASDNRFKGRHRRVGLQYVLAPSHSLAPRIWRWLPVVCKLGAHVFVSFTHCVCSISLVPHFPCGRHKNLRMRHYRRHKVIIL